MVPVTLPSLAVLSTNAPLGAKDLNVTAFVAATSNVPVCTNTVPPARISELEFIVSVPVLFTVRL